MKLALNHPLTDESAKNASSIVSKNRKELWIIGVLLIAWYLLNLITGSRSPTVWMDEVMYADPAINLATKGEFTSTAWYAQSDEQFWAGNVPLHELLLAAWLQLTNVSPLSVRSLNYLFTAVGTIFLWIFIRRIDLIKVAVWRIAFVALLLTGQGISFSFRSGRPDSLCFMLFSLCAFALTLKRSVTRRLSVFVVTMFLPIAGLQTLPALGIMFFICFAFYRQPRISDALTGLIGMIVGVCFLYALYRMQGVWTSFLHSIGGHTALGANPIHKLTAISSLFWQDKSLLAILAIFFFLLPCVLWHRNFLSVRFLLLGLAFAILIPLGMHLSGKFPVYYAWMAFVPASLMACAVMSANVTFPWWQKQIFQLLFLATALIGLPARIAVTALQWNERDLTPTKQLASEFIGNDDVVYCDFQFYYAARERAKKVYLPPYLRVISEAERESITALVVDPESFAKTTNSLPGNWLPLPTAIIPKHSNSPSQRLARLPLAKPYTLQVYRRTNSNESSGF